MGMCHQETLNLDDSERCFRRSLQLDPESKAAMNNLALVYVNRAEPEKAIQWADRALEIDPNFRDAMDNKSLACFMLGRFEEAWVNYEASLGGPHRREIKYGDEPRWNGDKGKTVVIYGEQGIGDEMAFSSMIPDAVRDCKKVILDCDPRLAGVFRRSFPEVDVYGTRWTKEVEWPTRYQIDARCSIGSLGKFYRNEEKDFPGSPFFVPDPERKIQWKALLDSLGEEPKIGIAFTGGLPSTGYKNRSLSLEQLLPFFKHKAHWISLQYKEKDIPDYGEFYKKHGVRIHHWKRATQSEDYDDTIALVSELDLVISVPTAVIHACGALGTPCWMLTPKKAGWFFGINRPDMPWYKSVRLFRQKNDWEEVINRLSGELDEFCGSGTSMGRAVCPLVQAPS